LNVDTVLGSNPQPEVSDDPVPSPLHPSVITKPSHIEISSQIASIEEVEQFGVKDKSTDFATNKISEYDRRHVTICHTSTQRVFNINLHKLDNELSLFIRHKGELIDLKLSEKFKQSVQEAHLVEEESRQAVPPINSIDELVSPNVQFNYKQLPVYYLRLAKVRLTGICNLDFNTGSCHIVFPNIRNLFLEINNVQSVSNISNILNFAKQQPSRSSLLRIWR